MNAFYIVAMDDGSFFGPLLQMLKTVAPFLIMCTLIVASFVYYLVYSEEHDNKKFQELLDKNRKSKKYNKGK